MRLPLDFPRSHHTEELSTALIVFFNVPLLLATAAVAFFAIRRPRSLPTELWLLALFTFVYLGGSTLASSLARYFVVVAPLLWLLVAAAFSRNVQVRLTPLDEGATATPT
ncbi:MAG: hypothetical protein ACOYMN_11380 [Roseimicrobium sp.]